MGLVGTMRIHPIVPTHLRTHSPYSNQLKSRANPQSILTFLWSVNQYVYLSSKRVGQLR